MFETLTERLQGVFQSLGRKGVIRQTDLDEALREVRLALLEADVHYVVVKNLLEVVNHRALGSQVSSALNPSQQIIKILNEEMISALGEPARLELSGPAPRVLMMVGLQGSGKTTTAGKLASLLRSRGERVWLVAADPYRPAASEQLQVLGEKLDIPMFFKPGMSTPDLCTAGVEQGSKAGASVVILDTAGRSQLDDEMMHELQAVKDRVQPIETILVADAMTGQEAVNIAQGFQKSIGLTGLILSKMDGDARGGAAISMHAVTGVPIKFIGTGESLEALETFQPDRLASRILGMGDMLSIIEKAEKVYEQEAAEEQVGRLLSGEFTLEDFLDQLTQMQRMGPLNKILDLLPSGFGGMASRIDGSAAEVQMKRSKAIIQSMTAQERRKPEILNGKRRRRIAAGSGTTVQEVNQLLRSYKQMKKMFKLVGKRGMKGFPPGLQLR